MRLGFPAGPSPHESRVVVFRRSVGIKYFFLFLDVYCSLFVLGFYPKRDQRPFVSE